MPDPIYSGGMSTGPGGPKELAWLHGEIKTPPFSREARVEAGVLLRRLQEGELIGMPQSRPMPGIGPRCHELRVRDEDSDWRIIYRIDPDAILIAGVFPKATRATPKPVIAACRRRLSLYDEAARAAAKAAEKEAAKTKGKP